MSDGAKAFADVDGARLIEIGQSKGEMLVNPFGKLMKHRQFKAITL